MGTSEGLCAVSYTHLDVYKRQLQWFMEDSVYQDMIANHRCDDVDANATFAWNGKVLDGGLMHIKGHSTCFAPKAKCCLLYTSRCV